MNTRFLESFLVIAECGSIAEAARRQNLTPAALAQRLRALEADLGQPLMTRSGRSVQPTEAGLAIVDHARALIAATRDLQAVAAMGVPTGQLRLGATATAMTGILPDVIARLSTAHPGIEYFVQPGSSIDLYHQVLEAELDAALLVQPQFALPKSVDWLTVREEPLVLLTPATLPADDLPALFGQMRFIRYDRNQWGGQLVDRYLRDNGLAVQEWLELDALDAISAMVARGLGIAIVPDCGYLTLPDPSRIARIPLANCPKRRTGVLWRPSGARIAAVKAFVSACREDGGLPSA